MTVLYLLAALSVAVSAATATLGNQGRHRERFVCKMVSSLLFCLVAFWAAVGRAQPMNLRAALMLGALVLGLVGDIVLGLDRFVAREYRPFVFVLGGAPFFFGHLLYTALLLSYGNIQWHLVAVLPIVPMFFLLLNRFRLIQLDKLMLPLALYGLVLGAMMLATFNLAAQGGELGRWMWFPGVLFTVSDASLFLHRFGRGPLEKLRPAFSYAVMLPYYAAQGIFALTVGWL
ncbi:MAG: lysoplasmalogenase [Oscillospiraceae bacterium]|nr:lysoplasmalogenase [Oscillospiraceae bacterium]